MAYDDDGRAAKLTAELERDEDGQARYILDLLRDYEAGGVEAAFVYTFANRRLPTTDDPERDYDLAARGIVRVLPDGSWTPKAAFHALAEYGRSRTQSRWPLRHRDTHPPDHGMHRLLGTAHRAPPALDGRLVPSRAGGWAEFACVKGSRRTAADRFPGPPAFRAPVRRCLCYPDPDPVVAAPLRPGLVPVTDQAVHVVVAPRRWPR